MLYLNILVTNDDGINAIGIKKLAKSLKKIAKVIVIAPDRERSATGHAITMHQPLRVDKATDFPDDIEAWSISGTPSDCVKIGIETIMANKPDLVVSGINNGPNLGTDVIYSGTVSAAIEGAIHGIPSLAMSIAGIKGEINYEGAASYSCKLARLILDNKEQESIILNANIPSIGYKDIKGIKLTELGNRRYNNSFVKREDPMGKNYYWLAGSLIELENKDVSDVEAIKEGFVSITPLHFDLTDYDLIERMKKWNFD
ncbi:5'/3'-nucleotidase SurE [Dethiothermospora halolimnae]|uniref:5'/3'-nucleotidase SurE n=1 Tax=Dethiothermospora halolimnae TaxID=3114390 RepID=UPI003CCB81DF